MMKILLTRNMTESNDYISDMLFHGLLQIGDIEVTDAPCLWYMYKDGRPGTGKFKSHTKLHGRGFTMYRLIGDDSHIDRTDIESRIKNLYYDLIIIGRADLGSPYEDLIFRIYPKNRILLMDGKDQQDFVSNGYNRDTHDLVDAGIYFKRELIFDDERLHPISCAFPREKIFPKVAKEKLLASTMPVFPGDKYVFDNEIDYYREYAHSFFAVTKKKGDWWEAVRHYEIMASGCVPLFNEIAHCPPRTLTTLPKESMMAAVNLVDERGIEWFRDTDEGARVYEVLQHDIFEHFLENCLTEHMAKYVLDTAKKYQ